MLKRYVLLILFSVGLLSGCAVNPVTGKSELRLVPESTEINLGSEQYAPSRQMQGGDYTVDPEVAAYVSSVGNRLAAVSDRGLPYEFNVINDSTPNAWALPGGKIAINRGLLTELNSEAELAAVLGHEIVHAAARHGAKGMERGMLMQGVVLAAQVASSNSEFGNLAVGGAALAGQMIGQKYGRDAETESDYYGMQYMARAGYDPRAAIGLQETFVRLSEGKRQDWLSGLFSSHPASQERVEANRETAKLFPAGGELGVERYRQKMATLIRSKEAYAAHDQGRKALAEGNAEQALALAEQALAAEPREGLFHSLLGDVRFKQGRYQDAVTNYDRALLRNGEYFHFFVKRGLAREQLGQKDAAYADLEKSLQLLPTATALNSLGNLALARGDRQKAKEFYAAAAGSKSEPGQEAGRSLVRLDLANNPNQYLQIRLGLDGSGYLLAEVVNPTGVPVADIDYLVQFVDDRGAQRQVALRVPATLAPGTSARMSTGIGPVSSGASLKGLKAAIVKARVAE
ncbi:M48 family metalloprotease [Trichloromonas sp.]|uniref:M48 family metalloprotease n=1 Tax=Trichloromonas sp. TaxID=3069249 RepID=UPI003D81C120